MALGGGQRQSGSRLTLLAATTIGAAVTGVTTTPAKALAGMNYLGVEAIFLYGAGGTTVKAWVQTSFDNGVTWVDVINFPFTTAAASKTAAVSSSVTAGTAPVAVTDGTAADSAIVNGVLGNQVRVKYTSTGTYTGLTSLAIYAVVKN
jgi:hypothetical protein